MRLDPNPLFRRVITPWYDSLCICWIMLLAMFAVILFSWAGIAVALSREGFQDHIWVPILLLALSLRVFVLVFYRMVRRHPDK